MTKPTRLTRALVAGAAAALVLPLAACAGEAGADEAQIRFTWWGSDTRMRNQQEFIDICMAEVPGLDVLGESASWTDYQIRLQTQAAANDLPDVFTVIDPFMYEYMDNGNFLDLREVADYLDLSDFPDSAFSDIIGPNGEVFGVSLGHSGHGLKLNPEVFSALGIDLPDDDAWSWADFADLAVRINEESGGEIAGTTVMMTYQALNVWLRQRGETLAQSEEAPINATVEGVASYLDWVRDLVARGGTPSPAHMQELWAAQGAAETSLIAQGQVGIDWNAINQLGQFEAAAGHALYPILWPGEQENLRGAWMKEGTWIVINSATEHPREAAQLINCLVNNVEGARIMGLDRGVPANPVVAEALEADLEGADYRFAEWARRMNASVERPWERYNTGVGAALIDAHDRLIQATIFNQGSTTEIAQRFLDDLMAAATE